MSPGTGMKNSRNKKKKTNLSQLLRQQALRLSGLERKPALYSMQHIL